MRTSYRRLVRLALVLVSVNSADPVGAQVLGTDPDATRADLERALSDLERSSASTAYSISLRSKARAEAGTVRSRLTAGDFRVGDRIRVRVGGPAALVDSALTVDDSLALVIPGIKRVALRGVLRSELEATILRELSDVVRQAEVSAQPLLRVAVLGQVLTPGFQSVPAEAFLDELITGAGGTSPVASITRMRLSRGDTVLMESSELQEAIARGRTLGDLGLRDGDALIIPPQPAPWDRASVLQLASFLIGPLLTLVVVR